MTTRFLSQSEKMPVGTQLPWAEVLTQLPFNEAGLLPAIAQQHDTGEVLMMAWMNLEAIKESLKTRACVLLVTFAQCFMAQR